MPMLAHVVAGGPEGLLWPTSIAMFGGLVVAFGWPRWRTPAAVIGAVGLAATVAIYATWPTAPLAPAGLSLRIASFTDGASVTSPLTVTACTTQGPAPGPGRILSVAVDGSQVVEARSSSVSITVPSGSHAVSVQLLTIDHRAFAPPVEAQATVDVTGTAPLAAASGCGA